MQSEDLLGNPKIDFPIAIAYGDRDFFGSEGSDTIIKGNRHFESGLKRSALLRIEDCGHNMFLDQPKVLAELMIGFFEGTLPERTLQLKPVQAWHPPKDQTGSGWLKPIIAIGALAAIGAALYKHY